MLPVAADEDVGRIVARHGAHARRNRQHPMAWSREAVDAVARTTLVLTPGTAAASEPVETAGEEAA